jgi:apolipoprotein D and lipocalin family protein
MTRSIGSKITAFLAFLCSMVAGCAYRNPANQLDHTVSEVDLDRYMGKWYEIASFPNWFQRGCFCSAAEYTLRDGTVEVKNSCRKGSPEGVVDSARGRATIVPGSGGAKLKVHFQWPFKGDYWIIALDGDYGFAMIGHPTRKYLWILSRTPRMDDAVFAGLKETARSKGYDVSRLRMTDQSCGN